MSGRMVELGGERDVRGAGGDVEFGKVDALCGVGDVSQQPVDGFAFDGAAAQSERGISFGSGRRIAHVRRGRELALNRNIRAIGGGQRALHREAVDFGIGVGRVPIHQLGGGVDIDFGAGEIGREIDGGGFAAGARGSLQVAIRLPLVPHRMSVDIGVDVGQQEFLAEIAGHVGRDLHLAGSSGSLILHGPQPRQIHLVGLQVGLQLTGGETVAGMVELRGERGAAAAGNQSCRLDGDHL